MSSFLPHTSFLTLCSVLGQCGGSISLKEMDHHWDILWSDKHPNPYAITQTLQSIVTIHMHLLSNFCMRFLEQVSHIIRCYQQSLENFLSPISLCICCCFLTNVLSHFDDRNAICKRTQTGATSLDRHSLTYCLSRTLYSLYYNHGC